MATKKKTEKESIEKKTRKKKEPARYPEFVRTVIYEKTKENVGKIREICEKFKGIGEIDKTSWETLDGYILDVSREYFKSGESMFDMYFREEPRKMSRYGISQRVREMQRKDMILGWISQMSEGDDVEWDIHCCYQIFSHVAIWLEENCLSEKKKPEE